MSFNINNFFDRLNYQNNEKEYFNGFEITDVIYLKQSDIVILKIENNIILPFSIYQDFRQYIMGILEHNVELYFKVNDESLSIYDLSRYLSDYSKENNCKFKSAYPSINNGEVYIIYDSQKHYKEDEACFNDLVTYLHNIGYHNDIKFKIQENKEYEVKEVEAIVSNKPFIDNKVQNNNSSIEKKNFTKKIKVDNYPVITIDDLDQEMENVCIVGTIFKVDSITTKNNKQIQTLYIKDINNACIAKIFENARFDSEVLAQNKEGKKAKFFGAYRYDKFTSDYVFYPEKIEFIEGNDDDLQDNEVNKRIELHAHTNKSEMDGICEASEIVKAAFNMGHEAVAITDHYVAQGFSKAQLTCNELLKKHPNRDFKILYGCEFSMVEDRLDIIYNAKDAMLNELEYVVFDLETTGLSTRYDSIIEFGAVKMQKGLIKSRKDFFIKPSNGERISDTITSLTHIKQSDVNNAREFIDCKDEILEYIKDCVLVAHNARFDYNFLNEELRKVNEKPLDNIVIDTLDLSRAIHEGKKNHKLGTICKIYGVEYNADDAHRADYDAEVLAHAFNHMLKKLADKGVLTIDDLANCQGERPFSKMIPYHTNVLVKNKQGLKDLFKLISIAHTTTLSVMKGSNSEGGSQDVSEPAATAAEPRILRSDLIKYRDNLLIGSGCLNGEIFDLASLRNQSDLEKAISFYDYIEVQPLENYRHLWQYRTTLTFERLKIIIKNIIDTALKMNKIVVATGDLHYVKKDQKILRDIYINTMGIGGSNHPLYIYNKEIRATAKMPDQHFRNTKEMLDEFVWLENDSLIKDLVINNPKKIADMIDKITPIHDKLYPPHIDGCNEKLTNMCYEGAHKMYGDTLDPIIEARLKRELDAIIGNGYAVVYYVSALLVIKSNSDGYLVGSRGSVGSSLAATFSGITEVNPLAPHYLCPKCKHLEWQDSKKYPSGFDLPGKVCPVCNEMMHGQGQDIPFETFLGFNGDKVPDIDLNFSGEYQAKAHKYLQDTFDEDHVFRAGTISTVAEKTAFGYVKGYCERNNIHSMNRAQEQRLASGCEGVKRTTGQHPGGVIVIPDDMEVYDFTPVQFPANDPNSIMRTTHFDFHEIHDNVLKFDILGHVDPTVMRLLEDISGINVKTIPLNDPEVISLFHSSKALNVINPEYNEKTGACGLPEFGTRFVRGILELTNPTRFSELVSISGLSHGTDVWLGNAKDLIDDGITLSEVIGCRDDIMVTLMKYGLDPLASFQIMEKVRKGKGVAEDHEKMMIEHNVPKWYIESCKKIKYMFPKAHAVAYVIMAVRIAWFKVYHPEYYYVSFFSLRCDAYDIKEMIKDAKSIKAKMDFLYQKIMYKGPDANMRASKKEKDLYDTLEICYEMASRGYHLSNIDINRSLATEFLVNPNDHHEIIPPFTVLDSLGENVALTIVEARKEREFISKEDLMKRTKLSKTLVSKMDELGILKGLDESNQLSLF